MEFKEEDIYAYTAAELLFPSESRSNKAGSSTGARAALVQRKAWLLLVVAGTAALQCGFFLMVGLAKPECDIKVPDGMPGSADLNDMWPADMRGNITNLIEDIPAVLNECNVHVVSTNLLLDLLDLLDAFDPHDAEQACRQEHQKGSCLLITEQYMAVSQLVRHLLWPQKQWKQERQPLIDSVIAFAIVAIVISVHRELVRAVVLARVVMSQIGWMPKYFAPLYIQPKHAVVIVTCPSDHAPVPLLDRISAAVQVAALLFLPLLQMATCSFAWLAAVKSFAQEAEEGKVVTIVLNSVAVLFVLELDNHVLTLMKETDALRLNNALNSTDGTGGELKKREFIIAHCPRSGQGKDCSNRIWCYWYAAHVGCSWLLVPTVTAYFTVEALYTSIRPRTALTLLGLYLSLVFLLFEPPLLPARHSRAWRWCHKGLMLVTATMAFLYMYFAVSPENEDFGADFVYIAAFIMPLVFGLVLYALWPCLASKDCQVLPMHTQNAGH